MELGEVECSSRISRVRFEVVKGFRVVLDLAAGIWMVAYRMGMIFSGFFCVSDMGNLGWQVGGDLDAEE